MESERIEALSDRERQIAGLASEGLTDKEIARSLRVSVTTVRTYWNRMRRKLGASNRAQAIVRALDSQADGGEERQAAFQKVLDTDLLGVVVLNEQGRIVQANEAFLDIVGYEEASFEELGLTWHDLTGTKNAKHPCPDPGPCVHELQHQDGSRISVISASILFEPEDGLWASYVIDLKRIAPKELTGKAPKSTR